MLFYDVTCHTNCEIVIANWKILDIFIFKINILASVDYILSNLDCSRSPSADSLFQSRSAKMLQLLKYHCFYSYNGMYFSFLRESHIRWYRRDTTWSLIFFISTERTLDLNVTLENGIVKLGCHLYEGKSLKNY